MPITVPVELNNLSLLRPDDGNLIIELSCGGNDMMSSILKSGGGEEVIGNSITKAVSQNEILRIVSTVVDLATGTDPKQVFHRVKLSGAGVDPQELSVRKEVSGDFKGIIFVTDITVN